MTRAEKIEQAARALLDGSEGVKLSAGTADVMNYWNRCRELRAALRAALALPTEPEGRPDAPDEDPAAPRMDRERCSIHDDKWTEGTPCKCGGRRVWHDGLGSTTTDVHWRCEGCGADGYYDGIDA